MKLFTSFKPVPWEQRDTDRRAAAVRDEQAPELVARLSEIAVQDPEPAVRRAALARISVAALLLERQRTDPDAATRAVAFARLSKLLLDPGAGLAPGARLSAVALDLPAELLERVAEAAPDVDARRAALARITRAAFLQRRCAEDSDATLRESLLTRIDGEDALDRLAETLRKRDKTLARRARERAESLRLARGDRDALQRYAMGLCETLTQWAQQLPDDIDARLAGAAPEWDARRDAFDEAMQLRVGAYFARVQDALQRRIQRALPPAAPPPPDAGPEAVAHLVLQGEQAYPEQVVAESIDAPPAAHASGADPAVAATRPAKPAVDWSTFDHELSEANRAALAKQLGEARPALQRVQALLATLPKPDRARRDRLSDVEARVDELDQWQRWSGNRVRARLCDDVETLIAAGHHPDAVANRVRELQQEWAKVEAAEPGDADRTSGLAKRFRALCGRAMAPTRPYFEQRHALREQRREALEPVLAQATDEAIAPLTVPAAVGLRRQLVEALRNLDELEPKARTTLARRLREGLTRIDAHLDAQREDAALARRKLIAKLRRELTHADPRAALEMARDAQQQWKLLPRAAREHEAELERELAALLDPLFVREREQREQSTQAAGRLETESRRILGELDALARGDADTLSHAEGRITALAASWKELHAADADAAERDRAPRRDGDRGRESGARARPGAGAGGRDAGPGARGRESGGRTGAGPRDARRDERGRDPRDRDARAPRSNDRERAFDQAVAHVRRAQAVLDAARRGGRLQALAAAAQLFAQVEQDEIGAEAAAEQWTALALALDDADRKRLAPRWQQVQAARGNVATDAAADASAERWLVDAEIDVGVDSPAAAQALRRQQQMQRLATRLQGAAPAAVDARERLLAWAQLGPLDPAQRDARAERMARIVAAWSAGT